MTDNELEGIIRLVVCDLVKEGCLRDKEEEYREVLERERGTRRTIIDTGAVWTVKHQQARNIGEGC